MKVKKNDDRIPCLLPRKAGAISVRENRFKFRMFSITTNGLEDGQFVHSLRTVLVFVPFPK
jgi:hypothetical protein